MSDVKKRVSNLVGDHTIAHRDIDMSNIIKVLLERGNLTKKLKKSDNNSSVEAHRGHIRTLKERVTGAELPLVVKCNSSDKTGLSTRDFWLTFFDVYGWPDQVVLHSPASGVRGMLEDSDNIRNYFSVATGLADDEFRKSGR